MPTEMVPALIMSLTRWAACWPEPHCASMVVAPVGWGSPACSQARRTMSLDCSPAWVTHAADDLLDQLGVDAGALEHLALHEAEQLSGVYAGEAAVALAERGADSIDDDGVSHGTKLEHVLILGNATPIFLVAPLFQNKPRVCNDHH